MQLSNFKGINNKANESRLPDGFLRECVDFIITNSGTVEQKSGYQLKSGGVFTALWSDGLRCFAVKNGDLVEVNSDYTLTTLRAGIGEIRLSFTGCNGDYYFVSDSINGIIKQGGVVSLGYNQVIEPPVLTAVNGVMLGGTYLVALTALGANGMESGTREPIAITISDNQAIQLSNIFVSRDPAITSIAVYCSDRNGSVLYRQGIMPNGVTSGTIADVDINTLPLATIGIDKAPLGKLIAYHYAHLFIASGNYLFYSEKFRYHHWRAENNYSYQGDITAIMPCDSGLWVSAKNSGLFWINGTTPKHGIESQGDFVQIKKHSAVVYFGSEQLFEPDQDGQLSRRWMVTTNEGIFTLFDGGQLKNETYDNINIPSIDSCTGATIRNNDTRNYLAIITGANVPKRSI